MEENMADIGIVVSDDSSSESVLPSPPPAALRLWTGVANGIDESETDAFYEWCLFWCMVIV